MGRSALAVLCGYLVFSLSAVVLFRLAGRDPHSAAPIPFMVAAIAWGGAFGTAAGLVAGRIARRDETMHGLAVAALMALGAAISMFATPGAARWTQISTIVIFAPCAILGGFLRSLFSGPSALSE